MDKSSGKPLKNVNVSVIGTTLGAVSDFRGYFRIKNIHKGIYKLRFSSIGHEDQVKEVVIKDDSVVSIGIGLYPSVRQLADEVIISAQRFERDPFLSAVPISFFTREQFLQDAPRNISEGLMGLPGVWSPQFSTGGSLSIRGLSGNQTLLMLDGIRLNNPSLTLHINPMMNTIDPYTLERVEVIRGSGAVQYGSDAIGGVAQIFTRSPRFSDEGFKVHGNSYVKYMSRGMEQSLRGELEISTSRFAISGGVSQRNLGNIVPGENQPKLPHTGYKELAGDVKANLKISSRHLLTLSYQQLEQKNVPDYAKITREDYETYNYAPRARRLAYARMTSFYENKWFSQVKITGSYQNSLENRLIVPSGVDYEINEEDQIDTWGGTVEVLSNPNPYWNIVSGVEYYHDQVGSDAEQRDMINNTVSSLPASILDGATSSNLALYSLHSLDILKLRLSFGGRANAFMIQGEDQQYGEINLQPATVVGNVGAMYPIHPNVQLTSSFNSGFRAPNFQDISNLSSFNQGVEVPNDSLGAEKSFTSELGLKAKTKHFTGSIVVYRTQLTDLIDITRSKYQGQAFINGQPVYRKTNIAQAFVQGVEAEVEVPVSRAIALYGSLAYTHGHNLSTNEPLDRIPPINSRVGLRYRSKVGIWSKMEWYHASMQDRLGSADVINPFIPIDGSANWNVVNLHIGYDFQWGYATIGIRN
ncbi:MAG: TonB-dependent receptor, partial [Bacteroidetes bacterium]|nr:TonB-dependent receptor [Bacteroidota bacterium]